ncbi:alpha/beta fold hydrolase [Candidatus Solincola tengchongensis]|uniref:alpha/beta hydrolase n=1 Tax=Candidatus Solincola tengchongensis TaxID=2900693 RepID=UPI00257F6B73
MVVARKGDGKFTRSDHYFRVGRLRCAAWLYLPEGVRRPPVVVMAHGFGAQRDFGLPPYAERFASDGLAVFLFDYRNFGASEGQPRNLVNPWRHLRDWRHALSYVRSLKEVDGSRVGLWGSSYSGGHALVTASRDEGVRAVAVQVPFVDGFSSAAYTGLRHAWQATVAGLRDLGRALTFREPYCVPIVSDPDTFGIMNTPESKPGYLALVPEGSDWKNECPARAVLELLFYRPARRAGKVICPALVILGEKDSLIRPRAVEKAASRMREVTIVHLPVGHFDVYHGAWFEKVSAMQADFFLRHLGT